MPETSEQQLATADLVACWRRMVLIRCFEEALEDLFTRNLLGGTSHFCIGQEACAVGVLHTVNADDYVVSNHRGHGHLLARDLEPVRVLAELLGRRAGYCGGRGGSQHMCCMERFFLGTNGITGGGIPIATGAAFALRQRESTQIVVNFFGDGATNQGTFHESLNMAALWTLPVLYVCENNHYAMSMPLDASVAAADIVGRAGAYGMRAVRCDGMDVEAVAASTAALAAHVRSGAGPALLELMTYRFCGHSKNDARVYRTRTEETDWRGRDCLSVTENALRARDVGDADMAAWRSEIQAGVAQTVEDALAMPVGDREHALGGVHA